MAIATLSINKKIVDHFIFVSIYNDNLALKWTIFGIYVSHICDTTVIEQVLDAFYYRKCVNAFIK